MMMAKNTVMKLCCSLWVIVWTVIRRNRKT